MKKIILAAIAVLGLGMAAANAQVPAHNAVSSQHGDQYNFMRGGGG
jgi:hypothetical protein